MPVALSTIREGQHWVILLVGLSMNQPKGGPYMNTASYDSNNDVFTYTQGYLDYEYFYQ